MVTFLAACQTTSEPSVVYIETKPVCEPATRPFLPKITNEELLVLSDETFYKLEDMRDRLKNWALHNEDIIKAVCIPPQSK